MFWKKKEKKEKKEIEIKDPVAKMLQEIREMNGDIVLFFRTRYIALRVDVQCEGNSISVEEEGKTGKDLPQMVHTALERVKKLTEEITLAETK